MADLSRIIPIQIAEAVAAALRAQPLRFVQLASDDELFGAFAADSAEHHFILSRYAKSYSWWGTLNVFVGGNDRPYMVVDFNDHDGKARLQISIGSLLLGREIACPALVDWFRVALPLSNAQTFDVVMP
jgi:hypothetical protein